MSNRHAVAALAGVSFLLLGSLASAQTPPDFTEFKSACMAAQPFLLGEVPPGVNAEEILTPLCGCLVTAFSPMSQKDVDVLTSDLKGMSTEESHKAYGDYEKLGEQAREGLNNCFSGPEVSAAMRAQSGVIMEPAPDAQAPAK